MKRQVIEEIKDIKYLFNYNRGKVISEQETFDSEDLDVEIDEEEDMNSIEVDSEVEMDEQREIQIPVRPDVDTPTKPKKPGTPYRPKPGPKKNPKAEKGEMPDWLSFDELGIEFE